MFDESLLEKPIFQTAFTHRSYLNESPEPIQSNERLEFLGDAVLSFIISSYLYNLRQSDTEGELTNLRSFIVKTNSLAKAAQNLNLGKYLRMSAGEEQTGGRSNIQIMANTFEAVLGAIYSDQGIEAAREFVTKNLLPLFETELREGPPKDAKSLLQEISQTKFKQSPKYRVIETVGPDHAKQFTVGVFIQGEQKGTGSGLSKQIAEEAAASQAITALET